MTTPEHDIDEVMMSPENVAPDDIQQDITAILRGAARQEDVSARIPAHVEVDILGALRAEGWTGKASMSSDGETNTSHRSVPRTVVPLPVGGRRSSPTTAGVPETASPQHTAPSRTRAAENVASLDTRRERKRSSGRGRTMLGLGVAAAVAVGTVGVWQHSQTDPGSSVNPLATSQVRVTGSQKSYSTASFDKQAAEMVETPYTELSQSDAHELGVQDVPTKEQLAGCVAGLRGFLSGKIDKVYADFGTYEGKDSLIVVAVQGSTRKAWALNRTALKSSCSNKTTDVQYGPRSFTV